MSQHTTYQGRCFCGEVRIMATGKPAAMGYCHCESCRHWSAGPVNAFTLWEPDSVEIVEGAENIASYQKTPNSHRKWCRSCGGHIFTDHPQLGLVDVYAAVIPDLPFQPEVHVHYQEHVLCIDDGILKLKDVPEDMGGTGIRVDARGQTLA